MNKKKQILIPKTNINACNTKISNYKFINKRTELANSLNPIQVNSD